MTETASAPASALAEAAIDEADALAAKVDEAAALLKSLSHPVRLNLLCRLVEREMSVGALAAAIGQRDALVSQHLMLLRREGIVATRREAQSIVYSIAHPGVARIIAALHDTFCPERTGDT